MYISYYRKNDEQLNIVLDCIPKITQKLKIQKNLVIDEIDSAAQK